MKNDNSKLNDLSHVQILNRDFNKAVQKITTQLQESGYTEEEIKKIVGAKLDYAIKEWNVFIDSDFDDIAQSENINQVNISEELDESLATILIDTLVFASRDLLESGLSDEDQRYMLIKTQLKNVREKHMSL